MTTPPERPIVFYRHRFSGHSHRVEVFLSLLGLPVTVVDVDLVGGEQRRPTFLALNRFGQVPVIDDGGAILADSNAILVYLALRYGAASWWPTEPSRAAQVQQWLSHAAGALARSAATARAANVFGTGRDTSAAVEEAHWLFTRLDASLAGSVGPWLVAGERPTVADIAHYTYTRHTRPKAASRSMAIRRFAPGWHASKRFPASNRWRRRQSA